MKLNTQNPYSTSITSSMWYSPLCGQMSSFEGHFTPEIALSGVEVDWVQVVHIWKNATGTVIASETKDPVLSNDNGYIKIGQTISSGIAPYDQAAYLFFRVAASVGGILLWYDFETGIQNSWCKENSTTLVIDNYYPTKPNYYAHFESSWQNAVVQYIQYTFNGGSVQTISPNTNLQIQHGTDVQYRSVVLLEDIYLIYGNWNWFNDF